MRMDLRDMLQAIREYPTACADLETARTALEESKQKRRSLTLEMGEQTHRLRFLTRKSAALQAALTELCPQISSVEEMKRLYKTLAPSLDSKGFVLYHMAEQLTGIDIHTFFPYEDNRGLFEGADGRRLLNYLTAAHFHAVDWSIVPGTTYESATLRKVDTSTPEYQAFEKQLYMKVLSRMGFDDMLAADQEVMMELDKKTELKLHCPLSGELAGQELDGGELLAFQSVILRRTEDERLYLDAKRGLMADFDGLDYVNDKVYSVLPSVEAVDGRLYGVAVCQVREALSPGELEQLKEFCAKQFSYGWGENLREFPCQTDQGELRVSFWQDTGASILTQEELESVNAQCQPKKEQRRTAYER